MKSYKKIQPTKEKLIIKPIEIEQETKAGLTLPTTAQDDRVMRGVVLAVGEGINGIEKDDQVLFTKYGQSEFQFVKDPSDPLASGEKLLVVFIDDVLAVIK